MELPNNIELSSNPSAMVWRKQLLISRDAQRLSRKLTAELIIDSELESEVAATINEAKATAYNQCHADVVAAQNLLLLCFEVLCSHSALSHLGKFINELIDTYHPALPPMSPVTKSFSNGLVCLDHPILESGLRVFDIAPFLLERLKVPASIISTVKLLGQTRLGFYQQVEAPGPYPLLQDIITGLNHPIVSLSGYTGEPGDIWLSRLLPATPVSFSLTTPYILKLSSLDDLKAYLKRQGLSPASASLETKAQKFFRNSADPFYWLEYVFLAYAGYTSECSAIFIAGIPDLPETLPHHPDFEEMDFAEGVGQHFVGDPTDVNQQKVGLLRKAEFTTEAKLLDYLESCEDGGAFDSEVLNVCQELQVPDLNLQACKLNFLEKFKCFTFPFEMTESNSHFSLAEHFLLNPDPSLAEDELNFLKAAIAARWDIYLVEEVAPGHSLQLRNIYSDKRYTVLERSASRAELKGSLLLARVLEQYGIAILNGTYLHPLPATLLNFFLKSREEFVPEDRSDGALKERLFELQAISCFMLAVNESKDSKPILRNTAGEDLEFQKLTYQINCEFEEVLSALKPLYQPEGLPDSAAPSIEKSADGLNSAKFPWLGLGNRLHPEWDNTVLGQLELCSSSQTISLTIEVNSKARAKLIKKEIKKLLGKRAKFLACEEIDMAAVKAAPSLSAAEQSQLMQTPEVQAALQSMAAKHWERWFDKEIPALDNQSPRAAAKTKRGRTLLDALLIEFERRAETTDPAMVFFKPDLAAIRKELNLDGRSLGEMN